MKEIFTSKIEEPYRRSGDIIRETVPISAKLADKINKSKWADYSIMMEEEKRLTEKYGISNLSELSPLITKAIINDSYTENELMKAVEKNLQGIYPDFSVINIEAKRIAKEFLETGDIRADTPENTTVLYNALLRDAKVFKNKRGEYKTLRDFSEEDYFGKSTEAPPYIECLCGKDHDMLSREHGKSLGLEGDELEKFIESRKDIPAYVFETKSYIDRIKMKAIIFNLRVKLSLGAIISSTIHEFGHNTIDKLLGTKGALPEFLLDDIISSKTIDEGISEDFAQYTLQKLDKLYENKGFDLLATYRQAASLETKDVPHKYGSSIVNTIREVVSLEEFQNEKLPELLKVISGEIKINEIE